MAEEVGTAYIKLGSGKQFAMAKKSGKQALWFAKVTEALAYGYSCMVPNKDLHNITEWAEANNFDWHTMAMETKQPYTKVWFTEKPKSWLPEIPSWATHAVLTEQQSEYIIANGVVSDMKDYTQKVEEVYALPLYAVPNTQNDAPQWARQDKWQVEVEHPKTSKRYGANGDRCFAKKYKLQQLIQHLNDTHKWSYDKIADWLDTLDNQPTFYPDMRTCTCEEEDVDCEVHPKVSNKSFHEELENHYSKAVDSLMKHWDDQLLTYFINDKGTPFEPKVNVDTEQAQTSLHKLAEHYLKTNPAVELPTTTQINLLNDKGEIDVSDYQLYGHKSCPDGPDCAFWNEAHQHAGHSAGKSEFFGSLYGGTNPHCYPSD